MPKRKSDQDHDEFINRLKNIFCQLNTLATFMYFKKLALSVESFTKAYHCNQQDIQYLANIAPDLIKLENGFIILKINDRKKNSSASLQARMDSFTKQLLLLPPQGAQEMLDLNLSKENKCLLMPFREKIEMDPPRCLLKCLINMTNSSFYKHQMSDVVEEKRLEPVYGNLIK